MFYLSIKQKSNMNFIHPALGLVIIIISSDAACNVDQSKKGHETLVQRRNIIIPNQNHSSNTNSHNSTLSLSLKWSQASNPCGNIFRDILTSIHKKGKMEKNSKLFSKWSTIFISWEINVFYEIFESVLTKFKDCDFT